MTDAVHDQLNPTEPQETTAWPHRRKELFTQDQLAEHARGMAAAQAGVPAGPRPIEPAAAAARGKRGRPRARLPVPRRQSRGTDAQPVPAEDWLRDNYHVVQDQFREVRRDLPKKFYLELPKLAERPSCRLPACLPVAVRADRTHRGPARSRHPDRLRRRLPADGAAVDWRDLGHPDHAASRLVEDCAGSRKGSSRRGAAANRRSTGRQRRSRPPRVPRISTSCCAGRPTRTDGLSSAFVVELLQWLRDQPPSATPAWLALQRALEAQDDSPEELLRVEHQREASVQLAMGNVITSMRLMSAIDWPLFFDRVSLVEQILREDPAGAYAEMDFPTRDRYRHSVEQLAKGSKQPELQVAEMRRGTGPAAQLSDPEQRPPSSRRLLPDSRAGGSRSNSDCTTRPSARERLARFFFRIRRSAISAPSR